MQLVAIVTILIRILGATGTVSRDKMKRRHECAGEISCKSDLKPLGDCLLVGDNSRVGSRRRGSAPSFHFLEKKTRSRSRLIGLIGKAVTAVMREK